jgi:hypothetical protein
LYNKDLNYKMTKRHWILTLQEIALWKSDT